MSYLEEFRTRLANHDFPGIMQLWEEYCAGDIIDAPEVVQILEAIKASDLAQSFGKHAETALIIWKNIPDEELASPVFRLIIDLQTTNHPELADLTLNLLQKRYQSLPYFNEKIRLVGLRNKDQFQGAVSHFELLNHMAKGKFVFHTGGWGVGEIIEMSLVREQLVLEFEKVTGRKDMSFHNAFKTLIPLSDDHFLAKRFGNPDQLEKDAKSDPLSVIRILLRDLGPKTATEIKDELSEWVIPEEEWSKWWQNARAKIKKDTMIESPSHLKEPFRLRLSEITHEERLKKALGKEQDIDGVIETLYAFVRDHGEVLKNPETKADLRRRIETLLSEEGLTAAQKLSLHIFLSELFSDKDSDKFLAETILGTKNISDLIQQISIAAFKKRALVLIREHRADWAELFVELIQSSNVHVLRDYILKEMNRPQTKDLLQKTITSLVNHPSSNPELFVWYFQKLFSDSQLPYANKEGRCLTLESFMMLMSQIENTIGYRDLVKKMQGLLTANRFALVRSIIEGTSVEYLQEFLLLVSKCRSLGDHDSKIMRSLAEVVQPSLAKEKPAYHQRHGHDHEVIWTTADGYKKVQARIQQIGTVETIENAREIEAARALGDLRENSEYKFALERRSRLQGELKTLTSQLNRARIITEIDIPRDEVGIGTAVDLVNSKGDHSHFVLLGPWDADPEKSILAIQSKFAQAMIGLKVGDNFKFQDEEYSVTGVHSYLEKGISTH